MFLHAPNMGPRFPLPYWDTIPPSQDTLACSNLLDVRAGYLLRPNDPCVQGDQPFPDVCDTSSRSSQFHDLGSQTLGP